MNDLMTSKFKILHIGSAHPKTFDHPILLNFCGPRWAPQGGTHVACAKEARK